MSGGDGLREALTLAAYRACGESEICPWSDTGVDIRRECYAHADAVLALPEVAALRAKAAAADRVRELHQKQAWPDVTSCAICSDPDTGEVEPWPCPTLRALDGDAP